MSNLSEKNVQEESVIFAPGTFEVILIVDTQETAGLVFSVIGEFNRYEISKKRIELHEKYLRTYKHLVFT